MLPLGTTPVLTTLLAYILLALFFAVIEPRLRRGQQAASLDAGASNRGTTRQIGIAFALCGLAFIAAPVLNYFQLGVITISPLIGWLGLLIELSGIGLRSWANRTLGEFYTRTLRVAEHQPIVQGGPYKLIHHPGYLGSIVMWVGAASTTTNWLAVLTVAVVMFAAYRNRILNEEQMLSAELGDDYRAYMSHSWKLVPLVY